MLSFASPSQTGGFRRTKGLACRTTG